MLPDPKLYRYSCPHVGSLRNRYAIPSRYTRRRRLGDNVQQYFAHLTRAGSNCVSLFILEGVDPAVDIQG